MKLFLIFIASLACVSAAPQGQSYEDEDAYIEAPQSFVSQNAKVKYYHYNTPEEEEKQVVTRFITPESLKRNKVIFVNVPPFPPSNQEDIDLPARVIDKTIVYVLVKKEKEPEAIKITTEASPEQPTPKVFVVKYKDEKDINSQIVNGVSKSKLYGKEVFTEDDVNQNLKLVKEVRPLKLIYPTSVA